MVGEKLSVLSTLHIPRQLWAGDLYGRPIQVVGARAFLPTVISRLDDLLLIPSAESLKRSMQLKPKRLPVIFGLDNTTSPDEASVAHVGIDTVRFLEAIRSQDLLHTYADLMAQYVTAQPGQQLEMEGQWMQFLERAGMIMAFQNPNRPDAPYTITDVAGEMNIGDINPLSPVYASARSPTLPQTRFDSVWHTAVRLAGVVCGSLAAIGVLAGCLPAATAAPTPAPTIIPALDLPPSTSMLSAPTITPSAVTNSEFNISSPITLTAQLLTTVKADSGLLKEAASLYGVNPSSTGETSLTTAFMVGTARMIKKELSNGQVSSNGIRTPFEDPDSPSPDLKNLYNFKITLPESAFNPANSLSSDGFPIHTVIDSGHTYTIIDAIPPGASVFINARIGDHFLISHTDAKNQNKMKMSLVSSQTITRLFNISGQDKFGYDASQGAFFVQEGQYRLYTEVPKIEEPNALAQIAADIVAFNTAIEAPSATTAPTAAATATVRATAPATLTIPAEKPWQVLRASPPITFTGTSQYEQWGVPNGRFVANGDMRIDFNMKIDSYGTDGQSDGMYFYFGDQSKNFVKLWVGIDGDNKNWNIDIRSNDKTKIFHKVLPIPFSASDGKFSLQISANGQQVSLFSDDGKLLATFSSQQFSVFNVGRNVDTRVQLAPQSKITVGSVSISGRPVDGVLPDINVHVDYPKPPGTNVSPEYANTHSDFRAALNDDTGGGFIISMMRPQTATIENNQVQITGIFDLKTGKIGTTTLKNYIKLNAVVNTGPDSNKINSRDWTMVPFYISGDAQDAADAINYYVAEFKAHGITNLYIIIQNFPNSSEISFYYPNY